jgi:zinc protease
MQYRLRMVALLFGLFVMASVSIDAQEIIPVPGPARSVNIPPVKESKLKNGLTVAVIEKSNNPLVSVQLLVKAGASTETIKKAGLSNITAQMLTKGTKTRSAEQIAEQMEFLGGAINSGGGWNNSAVTIGITSDKLEQALAIMADVALNPSFSKDELELLRSQSIDELKFNLTQPGFLANYVSTVYSNGEHPAGGTPASLESLAVADVQQFYSQNFFPSNAVLIFTGDVTAAKANSLAEKFFSAWASVEKVGASNPGTIPTVGSNGLINRILVVDLPKSGQASVNYVRRLNGLSRKNADYYSASVLNSLLGGGYSSRLNQEIRIKRGLSYGAGSSFAWRDNRANFSTRTQTKNESAAEVAELVVAELKRLADSTAKADELNPRKSVLTGGFGRNLETTGGLAGALGDLYSYGLSSGELNKYVGNVNAVTDASVKDFAVKYLNGGDMIIVGDYSVFKDDLAKRFPGMKIEVVKIDELNIESPTLKKSDVP